MTPHPFDIEAMMEWNKGYAPKLIGFCGPAGAGKTFAARHLASTFGYSRVRFAEPLQRYRDQSGGINRGIGIAG